MPDDNDPDAGLPDWAAAIATRLRFFARSRAERAALAPALALLRGGIPLPRFLAACLATFEETVATKPGLAPARTELLTLCAMARDAVATGCDDRAVIARAAPLMNQPLPIGVAAYVPGRVVWLGAMAALVPSEEAGAATMLVNDLAAVDPALPYRALRRAAG